MTLQVIQNCTPAWWRINADFSWTIFAVHVYHNCPNCKIRLDSKIMEKRPRFCYNCGKALKLAGLAGSGYANHFLSEGWPLEGVTIDAPITTQKLNNAVDCAVKEGRMEWVI